jgi:hypothetical protein
MNAWNRIRRYSECGPGSRRPTQGLKRKEKNTSKRQIIRHKRIQRNVPVIGIKWVIVTLFSLKANNF